jgi:type II secretory pathway component PulL
VAGFLRVQRKAPPTHAQETLDEKRHVLAAEDVSLFAIDLPVRRAKDRRRAAAFAVEEKLACALEAVHVALGPSLAPGRFLVALGALKKMPRDAARPVTPEQMLLPAPSAPDARDWHALRKGERVLARA